MIDNNFMRLTLARLDATKDVNGRYTNDAMTCVADLRACVEIVVAAELWTIDEVAAYFKISTKTVESWQRSGKIEFVKVNGLLRFRAEHVLGMGVYNGN